jgi:hypothetical protein
MFATLLSGLVGFITTFVGFSIAGAFLYPSYKEIHTYESARNTRIKLAEKMLQEGKIQNTKQYFDIIQGKNI